MNYKVGKCSQCDCGSMRPIVNKRHDLCNEKNQERLNSQRDPKEQKSRIKTKFTAIKQASKRKHRENAAYKEVCFEIMEERGSVCQGCGTVQRLSFSHLEPRSYSNRNVTNKEMIHIHCMTFGEVEGCHNKYEEHRFSELNDCEEIVEKLQKHAPDYYNLIQDKIR